MEKILILDNYDSFTYNLCNLVKSNYKGNVVVKRKTDNLYKNLDSYKAIIIGPGPGNPETTPWAIKLLQKVYKKTPILGVCLGMQCINYFFGGITVESGNPIHGKKDILGHYSQDLFKGIPNNFTIGRYHSLIIEPGNNIIVTGTCDSIPMAIKHQCLPIYGVQFHPESFLTEYGDNIIRNFLGLTSV